MQTSNSSIKISSKLNVCRASWALCVSTCRVAANTRETLLMTSAAESRNGGMCVCVCSPKIKIKNPNMWKRSLLSTHACIIFRSPERGCILHSNTRTEFLTRRKKVHSSPTLTINFWVEGAPNAPPQPCPSSRLVCNRRNASRVAIVNTWKSAPAVFWTMTTSFRLSELGSRGFRFSDAIFTLAHKKKKKTKQTTLLAKLGATTYLCKYEMLRRTNNPPSTVGVEELRAVEPHVCRQGGRADRRAADRRDRPRPEPHGRTRGSRCLICSHRGMFQLENEFIKNKKKKKKASTESIIL